MKTKNQKLKYRLRALANSLLPKSGMTERNFAKELNIPWSTYMKDKTTLVNDQFSMPESRLQKYAKAYGVSISDVLNYQVKQRLVVKRNYTNSLPIDVCREFGLESGDVQKAGYYVQNLGPACHKRKKT